MRTMPRLILALALSALCCVGAALSFVCNLAFTVGSFVREALVLPVGFMPRTATRLHPHRLISMCATALNGRQTGGVKIKGFLGQPAVRMLAG